MMYIAPTAREQLKKQLQSLKDQITTLQIQAENIHAVLTRCEDYTSLIKTEAV